MAPLAFLFLAGALSLGSGLPVAPDPGPSVSVDDPDIPEALALRVRTELGSRMGIPQEEVVLEWGRLREGLHLPENGGVRVLGTGAGGHWLVRVLPKGGGSEITIRVRAGATERVPVAATRLERGHVLQAGDIGVTEVVRWGAPKERGWPREGWVAHRVVRVGEELTPPAVRRPDAVSSGEDVLLLWDRGAVRLSLPGRAVGSGALGDRIAVRTVGGDRLHGTILEPGVVDVTRRGGS